MSRVLRKAVVWCALLTLPLCAWAAPSMPLIWLAVTPHADMLPLYQRDAPWQRAAAHIGVIKLYAGQLLTMPAQDLKRIFGFMDIHGIALAVEFGPLHLTGDCGPLEGFNPVPSIKRLAERVRRLGGTLRYAAMDEPYWFAHIYSGPRQCHWTAAQIAENAKPSIAALRKVFPDIAIGDIEPIANIPGNDLIQQYLAWARVWQQTTGKSLAFFDADVNWSPENMATLAQFGAMLQARQILFGVIYDGSAGDLSNAAWVDSATRHFQAYENGGNILPQQVIFQSWNNYPTRLLPDGDPDTFTHLVLRYLRARASFTGVRVGTNSVSGTLLTRDNKPLAGARVDLLRAKAWGANQLDLTGTVPDNAAKMLLAWRVNTECGGCDGEAHLLVGQGTYRQPDAADVRFSASTLPATGKRQPLEIRDRDDGQVDLVASKQARFAWNSPTYPVQPDRPFSVVLPYRITGPTTQAARLDIIFLDKDDHEVARAVGEFVPATTVLQEVQTDARGRFRFGIHDLESDHLALRYPGDSRTRATTVLIGRG